MSFRCWRSLVKLVIRKRGGRDDKQLMMMMMKQLYQILYRCQNPFWLILWLNFSNLSRCSRVLSDHSSMWSRARIYNRHSFQVHPRLKYCCMFPVYNMLNRLVWVSIWSGPWKKKTSSWLQRTVPGIARWTQTTDFCATQWHKLSNKLSVPKNKVGVRAP